MIFFKNSPRFLPVDDGDKEKLHYEDGDSDGKNDNVFAKY
jgi:hypothetical protein